MSLEYIGPLEHHEVVLNGRRVPHLSAVPMQGGMVHLTLDRRFGLDLSLQDAERVVPFIAHCLAIGMGYTGFPDEDMEPLRAHPMQRMREIFTGDVS